MKTAWVIALVTGSLFVVSWEAWSSGGGAREGFRERLMRSAGIEPVANVTYQNECASCHMAYLPGLLPARSWKRLMGGLDEHFGDYAQLDAKALAEITQFLLDHSADDSPYRRSRRIMRSLPPIAAPERIMDIPFMQREHREIPSPMIADNADVGSLSNCVACHPRAENGYFAEREISIPGYGQWDD